MSAAPEIITILRFHRLRSSPIVISDLTTRRGKREGGAHSINFVKRKSRSSSSLFLSLLPRSPSFSYHLLFSFPPLPSEKNVAHLLNFLVPVLFCPNRPRASCRIRKFILRLCHRRGFHRRFEKYIFHLVWFLIDTMFVLVTSCTFESVFEERHVWFLLESFLLKDDICNPVYM